MGEKLLLLAGTKKGLFIFTTSDRKRWAMRGPFQSGREINHAVFDSRTGRIFSTSNDAWFGSEIVWSDDLGTSWKSPSKGPAFAAKSGQKLERILHIEPGPKDKPNVLYAGVAPAALFRMTNGCKTWSELEGLTNTLPVLGGIQGRVASVFIRLCSIPHARNECMLQSPLSGFFALTMAGPPGRL